METATRIPECECGKCQATPDEYGNVDYGQVWSDRRSTYVTRNCPVARLAAERNTDIPTLIVEGWVKTA